MLLGEIAFTLQKNGMQLATPVGKRGKKAPSKAIGENLFPALNLIIGCNRSPFVVLSVFV